MLGATHKRDDVFCMISRRPLAMRSTAKSKKRLHNLFGNISIGICMMFDSGMSVSTYLFPLLSRSRCVLLSALQISTHQIGLCCSDVKHTVDLRSIRNKVIDVCCPVAITFTKHEGHSVGPLWDDRPEVFGGSTYLLGLRFPVGVCCSPDPGS